MLKFNKTAWGLPLVLLLAACSPQEDAPPGAVLLDGLKGLTGDWDVATVKNLPKPEGAFEQALFDEYVRLGSAERQEQDWNDTDFFLSRARLLSQGRSVEPTHLEDRDMPADSLAELTSARQSLTKILSGPRRTKQPGDAARAQGAFDCWMQEREENFQDEDIANCRADFQAALANLSSNQARTVVVLLPDLNGTVGEVEFTTKSGSRKLTNARAATSVSEPNETPAPAFNMDQASVEQTFGAAIKAQPVPPERFIVFFELKSADLTETSASQLPDILAAIARHPAAEVDIVGHADRSGSDQYNDALSLRRADAIRQQLVAHVQNAETLRVSAQGESKPIVETPDGVVEPQNRRVEITVR